MKKISKSKKGFTLVEMVLVIAIIVILAAAMLIGIGDKLKKAEDAKNELSKHNSEVESIIGEINGAVNP